MKEPPTKMDLKQKAKWSHMLTECVKEFNSLGRIDQVEECLGYSKGLAAYVV